MVFHRYGVSGSYFPIGLWFAAHALFCRYGVLSSYLPRVLPSAFSSWFYRYDVSSGYLPVWLNLALNSKFRRHDVSSSYSLGTNMDLPTLMLRRYRTSSSCLPNFKHRAYRERLHLRQCSCVTSYPCLSICSFTHLPFGATIWPVAFHCNLKTEAPQFRMYCVSSTRSVEGEGIVRHA